MKLFKYFFILLVFIPIANAENLESLENEALHTELVKTAIKFDVFNQRCRGVSMAKNFVRVNRLFISRYDLTANNYIKAYIGQNTREAKLQIKDKMIVYISEQGGCKALREKRTRTMFKNDFSTLIRQVEASSWIPEKTRKR